MEPINPKSSHHMTSLDKWTAWCSQHHQGNLSATPDKHEAFVNQLYTEALSSPALVDPARYYQNSASSIHTKLLKRHGYAEPDWNPLKSQQHRQRGKQLRQLNIDREGSGSGRIHDLPRRTVFDEERCLMRLTRNSLFVSKEFQESASFGQTDLVDVVSRGLNKSGSIVDEHLFLMHQFDPAAFNPMWWLSAQDVYLNDVKLSQQPYTAQDSPFSGQQAHSFVEMAAKGVTDAKLESLPAFPQAVQLGQQQPVFGRIPVLPKADDITHPCSANGLAQSLLLPALHRIGVKGPDAEKLCDDVLCKLLRNGKCCSYKSKSISDENMSRNSKHQQKGLSLGSVRYGARGCSESLAMHNAGYPSVKEDAQGSRFLTQKGGQHNRLLQLVDQLIMPGIKEGRVQASMLPQDNRQQEKLKQDCKKHLQWLHARKWTFFALAALYYSTQKQHRIFKDHPFFQNEEAVRGPSFDRGVSGWVHGVSPFVKYFPVPTQFNLPAEFRPTEERHPRWEASKLADQWLKRRDLAFEVCIQAAALHSAVNSRAVEFESDRKEAARRSKQKYQPREVSIDLRTAASKVAALLQTAMQTNKKNGCHPQSIVTLSAMFKDLQAGKPDALVHRSKNDPSPQCLPFTSLQGWMCIASASDVDAIVAELYV
ncbi:TPA: hypothetical protein ACH3X1_002165 [Trebouxia sp. C0004]